MLLSHIDLHHFRNFDKGSFPIHPSLTVIIGENARGKTNLLESIYFIVHGRGFRESKEEELMTIGSSEMRIRARFGHGGRSVELQIYLKKNADTLEKLFFIDKAKKKFSQFVRETTYVVLFSPEQIHIVTGEPEGRRRYLDKIISFYDMDYRSKLVSYENALRRRNKLLQTISHPDNLRDELVFWDRYLVEQGQYLGQKRSQYVEFLNNHGALDSKRFRVTYLQSFITKELLDETFDEQRRWKRTLIGPQKDDIVIFQKDGRGEKELHHFGSRSEQRMAIFWLKMNEIGYYETTYKRKPILLLDDVFSELDNHNKKLILDLIPGYQTVMSTTEEEFMKTMTKDKKVIHI